MQSISRESGPTGSRKILTKIKKEIFEKYPESLYLPAWIVKHGQKCRKFSYDIDIMPSIKWQGEEYGQWLKKEILPLLNNKTNAYEILIDLDRHEKRFLDDEESGVFEIGYLARRITDVVDNAFIAFDLAQIFVKECGKYKDQKKLLANSGFITQEIVKKLSHDKTEQEKFIFNSLIKSKKLVLAVSEDENLSYILPKENEVYPEGIETYNLNLFEKSDVLSMNTLERKIANLIDNKESVVWWVRNTATDKDWYAIRGWKKGKIRPDFIVAKKNKNNSLELVYVIESKGEHLINNPDTQYKKSVFDKMNNISVESLNLHLIKSKLNKDFQFELVEQGKEDLEINKLFN